MMSHTHSQCARDLGPKSGRGFDEEKTLAPQNFFNRAWHKFSDTEMVFVPEKPVSIENAAQEKLSVNCLDRKLISTLPRHVAPLFLRPKTENEWTIAWDAFLDTSRNKAWARYSKSISNERSLKPGSDGRQGSCHVAMFIHSPLFSWRQEKKG